MVLLLVGSVLVELLRSQARKFRAKGQPDGILRLGACTGEEPELRPLK